MIWVAPDTKNGQKEPPDVGFRGLSLILITLFSRLTHTSTLSPSVNFFTDTIDWSTIIKGRAYEFWPLSGDEMTNKKERFWDRIAKNYDTQVNEGDQAAIKILENKIGRAHV